MGLPSWWEGGPDVKWPPDDWKKVYRRYGEHAAWFGGDPSALISVYASSTAKQGVWRTNFDRFWTTGTIAPQTRRMLHAPLASDIATTSSDLLFSEPPVIVVGEGLQSRLDELLGELDIIQKLTEAAEGVSALGGGFLRVTWNKEFEPDYPLFDSVYADNAIPEWSWGLLQAVNFWFNASDPSATDEVYRKIERHEKGLVLHRLYWGTGSTLGVPMPLATLPEFAGLEDVVETGFNDGLTAVYVPNMRPNREFRGFPLGRSDYDGVEGLLDSLDEVWTSLMRDMRLARARLIVSQELVESKGKGKGSKIDLDQEIWEALPFSSQNVDKMITPSQFGIRTTEHITTATALVERIVSASGYAASTFGLHAEQAVNATATEIVNRERRTFITRDKKISYFSPAIARILEALLAVDAIQFQPHAVARPKLTWPDGLQISPKENSVIAQTLRSAEAASTETLVKLVNPGMTPDERKEEVKRITEENLARQPVKLFANAPSPTSGNSSTPNPGMPAAGQGDGATGKTAQ